MTLTDIERGTWRARELYGDFWFNSEPVPVAALRGNVILIFFWDYTCSSSLRAIPYLKEWRRKYEELGLVVVGVHTPRFPFAKDPQNVQKAIEQYGIDFPVVMDNGGLIWAKYQNRFWPTICLVDKDGFIRYQNSGEGSVFAVERGVQALVVDTNPMEELPPLMEPLSQADFPGAMYQRATPELYAGYLRGSIGNVEGHIPESVARYTDPQIYMENRLYLEGDWENSRDSVALQSEVPAEGHVILSYKALGVDGVFKTEGEKMEVIVRQDDQFLTVQNRGDDVNVADDGRSYLLIERPRKYNLVKNSHHGEHVLRLSAPSAGLVVFSFAFFACVIPEFVSNN